MADKRVWFITGAGRGMGVDIAQAALAAGHTVVATGRNPDAVANAVGETDDLFVIELDITSRRQRRRRYRRRPSGSAASMYSSTTRATSLPVSLRSCRRSSSRRS